MNKAVIFDLDGTIYYGNTLAYYANEAIEKLKDLGYEIIFFTNNSSKTREEIYSKLTNLTLDTSLDRVYTSSYATSKYLEEQSIKEVFLIGTNSFKKELDNLNINVVDENNAQAVVVGLDINFNYENISKALIAVNNGAKIIASNIDANYPVENGILKPGSNAIVSSIVGCSGKNVDYVVGKPNTYILETICKDWNLNKENIFVVGDGIDSDIAMANNYGCKSILVGKNQKSLEDVVKIIQKGM